MLRQQLQTTSTLSASRTSKPTLSFNKQTKSFNLASRATTPTCSAQVLDNLVQIPADSTKAEWFKVNTVNFYNMLAMLYGNMEYKCTSQSCPKMMAGAKYEYFWAEGEHARRPVSLPAPEYIKRLFDWAQELVEDESLFPLDDSPPGSGFDEACNKLFRRLPRIIMHLFYHHYHTMLAEGFGEHAVSILKHMVMFSMEHKLTSIDYYAPVQDILVQTLPPSYAQQFQSPSQTIVKPQQAQPQLQQPPVQTVQQHHPQRQPPSGSIFQTIRLTDELTPFSPASTRTTTITSVSSSGASPPAGKYSSSTTSYIDTEQKTMAKFVGLLEQVGLDEERARWYAKTLVENDIDESVFDSLTDETLKELGVSSIGHRLKIMKIKPLLQATEKGEPERENNFIRHDKKMKDKENEERLTEEQEKEKGPETEKENEKEEFVPTIQETELSFVQLIGRGNFGEVWKGTWRGTTSVAIKKLHTHLCDERSKKEFLAESELLMNIKPHPHLILPLGTCIRSAGSSGETDFLLVTEFIEDGSLDKFITAHKFDHYEKLNIAKGIAAGMQHLAAYGVVHRDLALRNVLMDFRGKQRTLMPKVTDLGLARQVVGEEVVYNAKSGGKVPVRWTAPEAFKHRRFTSKSDVWSFGIVLWELFSDGALPYFGLSNTEVAEQVSDWGLRLQKPKDCPEPIFSIMTECWHKDPDRRPSFAELFERLQQAERGLIEATAYYEEV